MSAQTFTLRPYQAAACDAVHDAHARDIRRPAIVLPTAAGKTVVFAFLIRQWAALNPQKQIVVLAHTTELVDQAKRKIEDVVPSHLTIGVVKAARDDVRRDIIVASVQTLASVKRRARLTRVGLVIVDECHHATARTYRSVLAHFGCLKPVTERHASARYDAVALGVTATMMRGDGAALMDIWQDIVFIKTIREMIDEGWLVRPRCRRVRVSDLDLAKVKKTAGDYQAGALGEAMEASLAPGKVVEAWREHADRKPTIGFWPTVHAAKVFTEAFLDDGISAAYVHGEMAEAARADVLARFRSGEIKVLNNCMVLTEGADFPFAEVLIIGRPTRNYGLYVQMAGRVLRLSPETGKKDALILDISGVSEKHNLSSSPIDMFGEDTGAEIEEDLDEERDDDEVDQDEVEEPKSVPSDMLPDDVYVTGELTFEEVDLFAQTSVTWGRTKAGVWFLATKGRFVVVLRTAKRDGFDVVSVKRGEKGSSYVVRNVATRAMAMMYAETDIAPGEKAVITRSANWRMGKPSHGAIARVKAIGVRGVDGMSAGEISSRLTEHEASERIDPIAVKNGLV